MTSTVSTFGIQLFSTANLQNELTNINLLTQQLASGQQHTNLTDYAPVDAQRLVSFQNAITQRQAYIGSMQTVNARLKIYDNTMSDMESLAAQANSLATQNQTLDPTKVGNIQTQVQSYMQQVVNDLNQQVGNRYIYAGTRYSTQPVNLTAVLTGAPGALVTANTLPPYDSEYNPPTTTTDAKAWAQDSVTIDANFNLQYGVTSVQKGFQELISGMQYINAATQTNNPTTYQSDMTQATQLLTQGLTDIQTYHTGVAAAMNTITQETDTQNTDINNLKSQIGDIQNIDVAQVGTMLNTLQAQLQASYSATATLTQESILKYL